MNAQHQKPFQVNRMVKGTYDFKASRKEELSFSKSERLIVIGSTDNPSWVRARNTNGQAGLISLDHVVFLQEVKQSSSMGWFHGRISREEAEKLLMPREDGFFLVRESTNFPGDYTLCVCYQDKVEHYRVISDKYKKLTIDDEEDFDTLPSLIEHYEKDADGLCTKLRRYVPNKRTGTEMERTFHDHGWTIEKDELNITDTILGKGEFGDVRLGEFKGQKVAVKAFNDKSIAAQAIVEEACHMTSLIHENLVSFIGIVFDESSIYLVTEYMSKGSLVEYLRTRGRILIPKISQINFACDICNGMVFLESQHFVHRDLAARNVLLHENGTAKVSDFGLTIRVDQTPNLGCDTDKGKFPIKWTAPEALKHNRFSNKSDMWSFGVLLWEIYSFGRVPYPKTPLTGVMKFIDSSGRMQEPNDCPPGIYQLMLEAWSLFPEDRPTFKEVHRKLREIQHQTPV